MALAKNPTFHSRSKHFSVDTHFIRERVQEGDIELHWVETEKMIADGLTKPLANKQFHAFRRALGLALPSHVETPRWLQSMTDQKKNRTKEPNNEGE